MNSRTTQPTNPQNIATMDDVKKYLYQLHNDLYPQVQSLPQNVPTITGLTGGTVTGANVKQGRTWTVSLKITGTSTASGASLTLPFVSATDATFLVAFGSTLLTALVAQGSSTLALPNWTTSNTVTIYGKADE